MNNTQLIAALEKATGPDRELDAAIFLWRMAPEWNKPLSLEDQMKWARAAHKPAFTASIDAALTLVPEGCLYLARTLWDEGKTAGMAVVHRYRSEGSALFWQEDYTSVAATPALAICIAALRARGEL